MAALPTLTGTEKRILRTIRHGSRDARFDSPTLCDLQAQRLVASTTVDRADGRLSVNRRWSITERGIAAYGEQC